MEIAHIYSFFLGIVSMGILQNALFQYPINGKFVFDNACSKINNVSMKNENFTSHKILLDSREITIPQFESRKLLLVG